MRPHGLIALDVDGTLIGADHRVSERTSRAIATAVTAGVAVVIATARGPGQLRPIAEQVPVLAANPVVLYQGALVASLDGLSMVAEERISAAAAEQAAAMCRAIGATVSWFAGGTWLAERHDALIAAEEAIVGAHAEIARPVGERPHKLLAMLPPERSDAFAAVHDALPDGVHAARSHPHYLEITSDRADKGAALRQLVAALGIDPRRTASVGDGENDLPMFAVTAHSFAMGQATQTVRDAATEIVATNLEDGCAEAIATFIDRLGARA